MVRVIISMYYTSIYRGKDVYLPKSSIACLQEEILEEESSTSIQ
jgi:hypothetical protein